MNIAIKMVTSCLLLCSLAAAQTSYDFKSFQNPRATITRVLGLNGHGDLVGMDNAIPGRHAFVVDKDSYSSLDSLGILGAHTSFARGINTQGDIVGGYAGSDGREHGFILRHGKLATFDVPFPVAVGTQLNAINDAGVIVGVWVDRAFKGHGFIYENGNFSQLEYPGARDTTPFGINSKGDIVGNWDSDQSTTGHGFVFSSGQITSFDAPNAMPNGTTANGINDSGQIVGAYVGRDGNFHGFIREGSTFTTIDCPGAVNTIAWGINVVGQIAGNCDNASGLQGFIASRTPIKNRNQFERTSRFGRAPYREEPCIGSLYSCFNKSKLSRIS